jgi:hypothetical protein
LWEKLPKFIRYNRTVRADIKSSYEDASSEWSQLPIVKANMITSELDSEDEFFAKAHRPVLDIDYEAALVPSSTPGHFHLYLDKTISHDAYMKFLEAAAVAGIIQWGFYEGAKKRGATSVRLPWIKKGDPYANSSDPDAAVKDLEKQIKETKNLLAELTSRLDDLVEW